MSSIVNARFCAMAGAIASRANDTIKVFFISFKLYNAKVLILSLNTLYGKLNILLREYCGESATKKCKVLRMILS